MSEPFKNPFESAQPAAQKVEPESSIAVAFVHDAKEIIFRPRNFFSALTKSDDWKKALTYAVIAHWLGTLFQLALKTIGVTSLSDTFFARLDELAATKGIPLPAMISQSLTNDALWVAIDPFFTVATVAASAFLLFICSLVLIGNHSSTPVTYQRSLTIASLATVPSLLVAIPFLGGFVASLLVFMCTVRAIESIYRVSFTRAVFTIILPKLVFFAALLIIGLMFFASIFGLVMSTIGA